MKEKTISSFGEYMDHIERYKGLFYFRGQKNIEWAILPSLFRNGDITDFDVERQTILSAMKEFPNKQPLEALYYAQHHGKATRICDLTISPLNALCFASEEGKDADDKDGVVFVVDKSGGVALDSLEVRLFSTVLTGDAQLNDVAADSLSDILIKNYVVDYRDFIYSSERAFRQGGTGIIFGFGLNNRKLISVGNTNVDSLIVEKIIIPASVKDSMRQQLRVRGISIDLLYSTSRAEYEPEAVTITQTEYEVRQIFDGKPLNKVTGKYKVSSVYFDRDSLYHQINKLYDSLFTENGADARIWTFFYFDDIDTFHSNWICRGVWDSESCFRIKWNDSYHTNRLMYQNEEISREEAFSRVFEIANEIMPLYEGIRKIALKPDYTLAELTKYVDSVHAKVRELFLKSQNIPFTDVEADKIVGKILSFIFEVHLLIGATKLYLHREDVNEKWIRYHTDNAIKSCSGKASAYLQICQEYSHI